MIRVIETIDGKSPYSHLNDAKTFADHTKEIMRAGLRLALAVKNGTEDDWEADVIMPFKSRNHITDELWTHTNNITYKGIKNNAEDFFHKAGDLTPFLKFCSAGNTFKRNTKYLHYKNGNNWAVKVNLKLEKGKMSQYNKTGNMVCFHCKKPSGKKMMKCGGCEAEYYCSTECQKQRWDLHKDYCSQMAQLKAEKKMKPENVD